MAVITLAVMPHAVVCNPAYGLECRNEHTITSGVAMMANAVTIFISDSDQDEPPCVLRSPADADPNSNRESFHA